MLGILKGSILVKALLCCVRKFENAYECSLLKKLADGICRSWRGSLVHRICSKYVNKKPYYQSSLIYKLVMAIGRLFDKPFKAIYRAFKPSVDNSVATAAANSIVGRDGKSRAYGAGLFLMAVSMGSLIAAILKDEVSVLNFVLCIGVFDIGLFMSFFMVFDNVIQDSLVVRAVKWIFKSLE